ncbi:uncharacterized protein LOC135668598 [Musa acuminata AAA Group]|uniref:(wild Malaysian banana) hypothetical protein n=2 Tax=Musa acuminata TaxID=4641 RepID=A0A804IWC6_MUSAM|nr:PREDICTED: uncharacterized protein LOC103982719 [Musa acuminata subsp. malaccensis]XP_009397991.1 PREDICTED: uncharacterized protein LOC103982719 [Musa acuminata subsp. malaccensis]XP_009397992.1 PREDICTED: uncharacterized protein LOC103982719 [Musa acuminata subsp. malaccensis]XP_018680035.1 PREDICTED: uncharacterized protein LOC103982719 [Musa acuminata subsp. malaccensis]CAG1844019.1 unnamed protein product [Musa acuminata subsp. malaccensis]
MSEAYKKVKAGRLVFKGGDVAGVDKKKRKKKKKAEADAEKNPFAAGEDADGESASAGAEAYTIDAAKRMKYEELFPVESKKFGYDPANKSRTSARTIEEALDDRVKKKADRYCK